MNLIDICVSSVSVMIASVSLCEVSGLSANAYGARIESFDRRGASGKVRL
jgi:hypothetical protein